MATVARASPSRCERPRPNTSAHKITASTTATTIMVTRRRFRGERPSLACSSPDAPDGVVAPHLTQNWSLSAMWSPHSLQNGMLRLGHLVLLLLVVGFVPLALEPQRAAFLFAARQEHTPSARLRRPMVTVGGDVVPTAGRRAPDPSAPVAPAPSCLCLSPRTRPPQPRPYAGSRPSCDDRRARGARGPGLVTQDPWHPSYSGSRCRGTTTRVPGGLSHWSP